MKTARTETFAKLDALQAYIRPHTKLQLRGDIVCHTPGGWQIFGSVGAASL